MTSPREIAETEAAIGLERPRGPLAPDTRIGRYVIGALLGEGGMGAVYLAHDPQLDRRVALKLLHRDGASEELRLRMTREARMMAKLTHPNIVMVFDAGEIDGQSYIAMELVKGETLEAWLTRSGRTVPQIMAAYRAAAEALAIAHEAGIVHRDFKPENALIDNAGHVKVGDFGIATDGVRPASEAPPPVDGAWPSPPPGSGLSTRTGTILGTPAYMAPEQLRGLRATAASDQFSLAVSVYEAIYRAPPFAAMTFDELRAAVLAGAFSARPEATRGRVPARFHRALQRAMSRHPQQRFSDVRALLRELDASLVVPFVRPSLLVAFGVVLAIGASVLGATLLRARNHEAAPQAANHKAVADPASATAKTGAAAAAAPPLQVSAPPVVLPPPKVCPSSRPRTLYFVLDNSAGMEKNTKWYKLVGSIAEGERQIGPAAHFGVTVLPGPARNMDPCAVGTEVLAPVVGDTPGDPRTNVHQRLLDLRKQLPSGSSPAGATLTGLVPKLSALGHTSVIFVTDGGTSCGHAPACDAHDCTTNIEQDGYCHPDTGSCCQAVDRTNLFCTDESGTVAALKALRKAGVKTYVVGLTALPRYEASLNDFAQAGGTAHSGARQYFDATIQDVASIDHAIQSAMSTALSDCD